MLVVAKCKCLRSTFNHPYCHEVILGVCFRFFSFSRGVAIAMNRY